MGKTFRDKQERLQYMKRRFVKPTLNALKKRNADEECDLIIPFTPDEVDEELQRVEAFIEDSREGKIERINSDDSVSIIERWR